ncbi:hypothetical protein AEQU1_00977 [Aequorivita sp. CIP111184]|nr:hypothetical protein AEQU1_00977 [Aequorivita sp. CIP111184]
MLIFVMLKKHIMQFLKSTKLYSIFTGKCPVCHKGEMYLEKNPYKISKLMEMHDHCSHCGKKFKIEPSFFFGAMYVSYGVGVAISVATFIISYFIIGIDRNYSFLAIILTLAILFPLIIRISRNIWINIFVDFDEKAAK